MNKTHTTPWAALAGLALVAALAAPAGATDLESYGYVRILEGAATLHQGDERLDAEANQPLLTGDRVVTARGSRLEIVLPDRTMVRLGPDAELTLDRLAYSADFAAQETLLFLQRGAMQLTVPPDTLGGILPRVDTGNSTVYVQRAGSYRIEAWSGRTQLVVRDGSAELYTPTGTEIVRAGQEAWVQGTDRPQTQVRSASALDALERWGQRLDAEVATADLGYVDSSLRYAAAPLARHGRWTHIDNRPVWRPYVSAGWSPYRHGRWVHTPSGLTWVSYEPWGWMTYHYGTWDLIPGYGWSWFPGHVYAPAWVYWYWGPSHVGWTPTGYYWRFHYGPSWHRHWGPGFRFHFGVHGWAGGRTNHFRHWNFVEGRRLDDRRLAHYTRSGAQLQNQGRLDMPRGIIATDTRTMRPEVAARPQDGMRTLQTRPAVAGSGRGGDLPDLSRFIARDPNTSEGERRAAIPIREAGAGESRGTGAAVARPGATGEAGAGRPGATGGETRQPGRVARPSGGDGSDGTAAPSRGAEGSRPGVQTRPAPRPDGDRGDAGRVQQRPATRPDTAANEHWRVQGRPERGVSSPGTVTTRPSAAAPVARPGGRASEASRAQRPTAPAGSSGGGQVQTRPAARPQGQAGEGEAATSQRPSAVRPVRPSGGDGAQTGGEAWRSAGRPSAGSQGTPSSAGSRPPVRRVVEGVRSNRAGSDRPAAPQAPAARPPVRPQAPAASAPQHQGGRAQAPAARPPVRPQTPAASAPQHQGGRAQAPAARPPVRPQAPAASAPQRQGGRAQAPAARPSVRPQAPAASAPQGRPSGSAQAPARPSSAPRATSPRSGSGGRQSSASSSSSGSRSSSGSSSSRTARSRPDNESSGSE